MRDFWKWMFLGLGLVALYLLLVNAGGAANLLSAFGSSLSGVYKTLQGR